MKKILLICAFIILITGCEGIFKEQGPNDAINFKNSYEILNDTEIDINNKIVYITFDETLDLIKNETGILFLGNSNDTLSKALAPSLIEVTNTINTNVYYYEMNDDDSIAVTNLLKENISEINAKNATDIPLILFIKNGNILDYFYGYNNEIIINKNYDLFKSLMLDKYRKLQ